MRIKSLLLQASGSQMDFHKYGVTYIYEHEPHNVKIIQSPNKSIVFCYRPGEQCRKIFSLNRKVPVTKNLNCLVTNRVCVLPYIGLCNHTRNNYHIPCINHFDQLVFPKVSRIFLHDSLNVMPNTLKWSISDSKYK